jgi:histidine triad (HIT) family protein
VCEPCPFCQFIREMVDEPKDYVVLDHLGFKDVATFIPIDPVVSGHRLFIPTFHVEDAAHNPAITARVFIAAATWANGRRKPQSAFNLITSAGKEATQSVFHLHVHYVPRSEDDGLSLPWPSKP